MDLIPAIDLLDGQCVRLTQGDFNNCQVYTGDSHDLARRYDAEGANWLHIVDLAASRDGEGADTSALFELLSTAPQKVQTGGGVRTGSDVRARLDAGADRVVIGSMCVTDTERFLSWIHKFGADRIVAALDVRHDAEGVPWPRIFGWTEAGGVNLWDLLDRLARGGLRHALVTDISRDGEMRGPNTELYKRLTNRYSGLQVQASGGVSSLQDLQDLANTDVAGAITGKALLENIFTVKQALEVVT